MRENEHALDPAATEPQAVSALVGIETILSVPSFSSAGYLWAVNADAAVLEVVQRRDPPLEQGVPLADLPVGSGPPVSFSVKPLAPGRHTLTLDLRRPWEDGPRRSLSVNVEAHRPHIFD